MAPLHRVASVRTGLEERESLYELFPGSDSPVAATWLTGELVTGHGEDLEHPHIYMAVYPHYRIFTVEAGRVTSIIDRDREWWYAQHPSVVRDGKTRGIFDDK